MDFTCLIILLIIPVGLIVKALADGVRLWRHGADQPPSPARTTLRWLAMSLIEPTLNTIIVGLIYVTFLGKIFEVNDDFLMHLSALPTGLLLSAPMAVLLLPLAWAARFEGEYRRILLALGLLGALRWIITAVALVVPYFALGGLAVLIFSIRWVNEQGGQIDGRTQAICLGPQGVMVGQPEDFSREDHSEIRFWQWAKRYTAHSSRAAILAARFF